MLSPRELDRLSEQFWVTRLEAKRLDALAEQADRRLQRETKEILARLLSAERRILELSKQGSGTLGR